ncbi:MAG: hypothetical protein WAK66_16035 [Methylocystis sp.]
MKNGRGGVATALSDPPLFAAADCAFLFGVRLLTSFNSCSVFALFPSYFFNCILRERTSASVASKRAFNSRICSAVSSAPNAVAEEIKVIAAAIARAFLSPEDFFREQFARLTLCLGTGACCCRMLSHKFMNRFLLVNNLPNVTYKCN